MFLVQLTSTWLVRQGDLDTRFTLVYPWSSDESLRPPFVSVSWSLTDRWWYPYLWSPTRYSFRIKFYSFMERVPLFSTSYSSRVECLVFGLYFVDLEKLFWLRCLFPYMVLIRRKSRQDWSPIQVTPLRFKLLFKTRKVENLHDSFFTNRLYF